MTYMSCLFTMNHSLNPILMSAPKAWASSFRLMKSHDPFDGGETPSHRAAPNQAGKLQCLALQRHERHDFRLGQSGLEKRKAPGRNGDGF